MKAVSCNSSNPVVANAMNATAKNGTDNGDVLVEFVAPNETGLAKVQKRMSSREFETWLEKTGNAGKAQEIWFALSKGDQCSFLHAATKVSVRAL
jgi:hypothetical protein